MKQFILAMPLFLFLCSCGAFSTMTDGFRQANAVASHIERDLGQKPQVGFNRNNGVLSRVTVTFDGMPAGKSFDQIADSARASIKVQFQQEPREILLGFSIKPTKQTLSLHGPLLNPDLAAVRPLWKFA